MVLHPRHKLQYFERAGWEADWITTAKEIVRTEFERSYASSPAEADKVEVLPSANEKSKVRWTSDSQNIDVVTLTYSYKKCNIFDDLPALAAPKNGELRDELSRYLNTDPEQAKDVLLWWHEHESTYPHLSRMALYYLTIPGLFSMNSRF